MSLPLLRVRTAHSEYVINQNDKTVTRHPHTAEAANLAEFFGTEPKAYDDIVLCDLNPGGKVVITYPDGSWTQSTRVESVTEIRVGELALTGEGQ